MGGLFVALIVESQWTTHILVRKKRKDEGIFRIILLVTSYLKQDHIWDATWKIKNHYFFFKKKCLLYGSNNKGIVVKRGLEECYCLLESNWGVVMATSVMSSLSLKPSSFNVVDNVKGLPSLTRCSTSFTVRASGGKKIKTDKPYGISLIFHLFIN